MATVGVKGLMSASCQEKRGSAIRWRPDGDGVVDVWR